MRLPLFDTERNPMDLQVLIQHKIFRWRQGLSVEHPMAPGPA